MLFPISSLNILPEKLQEQESWKVILIANAINMLQFKNSFRHSVVSSGKKLVALNYYRSTIISIYKLKKLS